MNRKEIIESTIAKLKVLPDDKIILAHDFTEFLHQKYEEYILNEGIKELTTESKSFKFLEKESEIYSVNDIKEKYNAER